MLYASIHRGGIFPGTGPLLDVGSGAGTGFSINLPVEGGSREDAWLSLLEWIIVPSAIEYSPDLILISAGYDAHRDDPLGGCALGTGSFAEMARHVRALGERVGAPVGAVLEGGYDLGGLAARSAPRWRPSSTTARPTPSRPTSPPRAPHRTSGTTGRSERFGMRERARSQSASAPEGGLGRFDPPETGAHQWDPTGCGSASPAAWCSASEPLPPSESELRARATAATFAVTPQQLQINQSISSAAVKRSNRALNYLAPIRTAADR